jgi:Tfp pilus assembly protein PilF
MTSGPGVGRLADPMSDETTVLLVKGGPLPDGLQAQLEAKGVFVEEASPSHLEASLVAVAPDLVLVFGSEALGDIVAKVSGEGGVPIVVVADRQDHRDLRQKYKEALATIIPSDLPQAALSHRIATLSRRASKGEALVQTMSLAPPKPGSEAKVAAKVELDAPSPVAATASGPRAGASTTIEQKLPGAAKTEVTVAKAPTEAKTTVAKALVAKPAVAKPATDVKGSPAKVSAEVTVKAGAAKAVPAGPKAVAAPRTPVDVPAQSAATTKSAGESRESAPRAERASLEGGASMGTSAKPEQGGPGKRPAPLTSMMPANAQAASVAVVEQQASKPVDAPLPLESGPKSSASAFDLADEYPTAAFKLPLEMQQKARRDSLPPETVRRQPSDDELGRISDSELIAQELEARQRLSSGGDEAPRPPTAEEEQRAAAADQRARSHRRSNATASAVRLVLCDDDLTRADSLASELREHGLDVMLLSPEHSQVRWPRLRRFAPHGLLVDERSLSKGGRQIVSAFRRDPFLKYVPLVVVPFQRIYRESEARANLAPVFPLLAPLGREELGLLEQLAKKEEIVVELSQILPSRLVEVLAENEATCVLTTSGDGRRLTWPIAAGRAGKAELSEGVGSQGFSLKPEDALRFLLDQDEAQVQVLLRPQIHLTAAEPIGPLLDRVTTSIEPPLQHSVAPSRGADPAARPGAKATLLGVAPPPSSSSFDAGPGGLPTIPAPPGSGIDGGPEVAADLAAVRASSAHQRTVVIQRSPLQDSLARARRWAEPGLRWLSEKKRAWPPAVFWGAVTAPILILLIVLLVSALSGDEAGAPEGPAAEKTAAAAAPAPGAAPHSSPAAPSSLDRFRVAEDAPARSCDDVLGDVTGPVTGDASSYWKMARQALMQGNVDRAHELMCRAVAREPASPAAEGLVAFYLGRRATGQAERYVQGILGVDAERRTALELQSDVKNQQGHVDEALRILLQTLKLEPSDDVRRGAVSRKLSAEADLAIKSGDFPLAERLLRRAVVLSPANDQATLRLAEVFLRAGLRDAARLWAEVLLAGPSRHAEAHMILGDVARQSGDGATARRHYEQVGADSGQYTRAQNQLKALP